MAIQRENKKCLEAHVFSSTRSMALFMYVVAEDGIESPMRKKKRAKQSAES
jgi:hypothetical protein